MNQIWAYLVLFMEAACLVVSVLCLRGEKELHWKLMPVYLALVAGTEWAGYLLSHHHHPTTWLYNLFLLAEGFYISYFVYSLCRPYTGLRKHLVGFWVLFAGSNLAELLWRKQPDSFNSYTAGFLSVCMLGACLYYYSRIYRDATIAHMHAFAGFYWVSGIFFFYAGTLFSDLLFKVLMSNPLKLYGRPLSFYFFVITNVWYYSLWIISLFLRRRNVRSSG